MIKKKHVREGVKNILFLSPVLISTKQNKPTTHETTALTNYNLTMKPLFYRNKWANTFVHKVLYVDSQSTQFSLFLGYKIHMIYYNP